MKGWVDLDGHIQRWFTWRQQTVTHPSSNRARCIEHYLTALIEINVLTTTLRRHRAWPRTRNIKNKIVKAFCTFVRPMLEYCCVTWSPMYKYDIDRIEAVQRRFTKRLRGLYHMPYTSRLCQLHLDSLASRRIEADLVMCYKILNNLVCIDRNHFLPFLLYVSLEAIPRN